MNSRVDRSAGGTGITDILDRVGVRSRTVGIVALVATVALVASAGRSLLQSQQHEVNTTVFVARVLPGSSTGDVDASIADFITVLGLPIVRDPVSRRPG